MKDKTTKNVKGNIQKSNYCIAKLIINIFNFTFKFAQVHSI